MPLTSQTSRLTRKDLNSQAPHYSLVQSSLTLTISSLNISILMEQLFVIPTLHNTAVHNIQAFTMQCAHPQVMWLDRHGFIYLVLVNPHSCTKIFVLSIWDLNCIYHINPYLQGDECALLGNPLCTWRSILYTRPHSWGYVLAIHPYELSHS